MLYKESELTCKLSNNRKRSEFFLINAQFLNCYIIKNEVACNLKYIIENEFACNLKKLQVTDRRFF